MGDREPIPGKFTWFELVTKDVKKAQAFYGEVLGWKVQGYPMGPILYEMIVLGDTMLGGYAPPTKEGVLPHWLGYVSVEDVDATVAIATANGAKVVQPASDIPNVGRRAGIVDPEGAAIAFLKNTSGDPPDADAPFGGWVWNELHTPDTAKALAFYEKVLGFSHRAMDMGPAGTYHIVSKDGVDRGGVTSHIQKCAGPSWLPYVAVDDADATAARVVKNGGSLAMAPESVPGVGRIAVMQDPTGAILGMIKPLPRQQK
jgi:predicted enzyme related to lactoylglutathione lyase